MRDSLLYHIEDPNHPGDLNQGYVGVVYKDKCIESRFNQHRSSHYIVGQQIRNLMLNYNSIKVIFEGSLIECYKLENELRPLPYIGWNIATGGGGPLHGMTSSELKKNQSIVQSKRMSDLNLKNKQSKSFKENYYNNTSLQALRKLRAIEHMSDPDKKAVCLNAIHKKIKCPHCEFQSNVGNVSQHIKRKHNNEK